MARAESGLNDNNVRSYAIYINLILWFLVQKIMLMKHWKQCLKKQWENQ